MGPICNLGPKEAKTLLAGPNQWTVKIAILGAEFILFFFISIVFFFFFLSGILACIDLYSVSPQALAQACSAPPSPRYVPFPSPWIWNVYSKPLWVFSF